MKLFDKKLCSVVGIEYDDTIVFDGQVFDKVSGVPIPFKMHPSMSYSAFAFQFGRCFDNTKTRYNRVACTELQDLTPQITRTIKKDDNSYYYDNGDTIYTLDADTFETIRSYDYNGYFSNCVPAYEDNFVYMIGLVDDHDTRILRINTITNETVDIYKMDNYPGLCFVIYEDEDYLVYNHITTGGTASDGNGYGRNYHYCRVYSKYNNTSYTVVNTLGSTSSGGITAKPFAPEVDTNGLHFIQPRCSFAGDGTSSIFKYRYLNLDNTTNMTLNTAWHYSEFETIVPDSFVQDQIDIINADEGLTAEEKIAQIAIAKEKYLQLPYNQSTYGNAAMTFKIGDAWTEEIDLVTHTKQYVGLVTCSLGLDYNILQVLELDWVEDPSMTRLSGDTFTGRSYTATLKSKIEWDSTAMTDLRGMIPVKRDYSEILLCFESTARIARFNEGTLEYDVFDPLTSSYAAIGIDSADSIYVLSNLGSVEVFNSNIPLRTEVTMAESEYMYTGSDISTSCLVNTYDYSNNRIATSITLRSLNTNLKFIDNAVEVDTIEITTATDADTTVQCKIKGYGEVLINAEFQSI